jgi:hypothetical protein
VACIGPPAALVLSGIVAGFLAAACANQLAQPRLAPCSVATATSVELAVGEHVALDPAVSGACFGFPANQSVDSAEYVIVAQSVVSLPNDSSPFMLTGITSAGAGALVAGRRFAERRARSNAAAFDAFRHGASRPWNARSAVPAPFLVSPATALVVGSVRSFVVCGDLTCDSTVRVGAVAQAVGTNVAIYIDTLNPAGTPTAGLAPGDLDSLLHLLDTRIAPLDVQTFGGVSDVDGNGVVIALLTPVVNRLVTRIACEQNGFIAGFFFPGDLAPHGAYNNGEIYYSVVPDPDSLASCAHTVAAVEQLTPPTFAHELEHMINYGQHVLSRPSGPGPEQGWLDEGLARYAEELAARSFLPGDTATFHGYLRFGDLYDAYQYLLNPGDSYLLLVEDNGTLAETGASWLFIRYLVDQYGPTLAGRLVESPLVGPANVVSQTGTEFPTLVTNWALATWVSDLPGFLPESTLRYTSWSFRATFDSLHRSNDPATSSRYPLPFPLVPAETSGSALAVVGELRSGSGTYARALQGPGAPPFAVAFTMNGMLALPATIAPRLTVIRVR